MGVVTVSKPSTNMLVLGKGDSDRITVSFRYDPQRGEKVKTIHGRKWHPEEKHWSFPNTDGTLEKILDVFIGIIIAPNSSITNELCKIQPRIDRM